MDVNFATFPVTEAVLIGAKNAAIAGTVVAVPTVRICLAVSSRIVLFMSDFS